MESRLEIRLPEELKKKAKEKADFTEVNLSVVIREFLEKWIEN